MAQLPTQSQFGDYSDWPGRDVLDSGGQRLGGVREIYLDRETGRPEWVLVDVTDSEARFVPLANADVESWSIRVAHDAEKIRSAPGIGAEPRIDQSEERRLYAHYGLAYSEIDRGTEAPPAPTGWGGDDETPSWQARGGDSPTSSDTAASPPSAYEAPATASSSTEERTSDTAPTADAPLTPPWRTEAEPTNDAPPPAEPPSPAEIESAHIPEETPASSDRASAYETAPFGAVAPPPTRDEGSFAPPTTGADEPPAGTFATSGGEDPPAGTFATSGGEDPPAGTFATTDEPTSAVAPPTTDADEPPAGAADPAAAFLTGDPVTPFSPLESDSPATSADALPEAAAPLTDDLDTPALTPHAAAPDEPPTTAFSPPTSEDPTPEDRDTPFAPPSAADALATPIDAPSTLTPPAISHGADASALPPVTADAPVADDTPKPSWASTPPPLPPEPAQTGTLERVKRSPGKMAVAALGAAVLFFIVRRLR